MIEDIMDLMCSHYKKPRVKNGMVRGVQRYKCLACGKTFVESHKNRSLAFQKYLELLMLAKEGHHSPHFKPATVDRWLLEAKEHHPWFMNNLIWMGVKWYKISPFAEELPARDPARWALNAGGWVYGTYEGALGRDPNVHLPLEFSQNMPWLLYLAGDRRLQKSIYHAIGKTEKEVLALCHESMRIHAELQQAP